VLDTTWSIYNMQFEDILPMLDTTMNIYNMQFYIEILVEIMGR
jgi:hypothetical protein